jgi:hypothetical protein
MLKTCNRCGTEKHLSDFRKDKSNPDGYQYCCKLCRRDYDKSNYMQKYGDKVRERNRNRYNEVKPIIDAYKQERPCLCGESDPVCLEFHHLNPEEKDFEVTDSLNRSLDTLFREIRKCIVLCANCHKKVHAGKISLILR